MKRKTKILILGLAIVCAIIFSFILRPFAINTNLADDLFMAGIFSFLPFVGVFFSLYEIIKKINIKYNLCLFIMAISVLVFIASFFIAPTCVGVSKNIMIIIMCISFTSLLIFGLLAIFFEKNIIQNQNEK